MDASTSSMVAVKVLKDSASRTAEEDFVREVNIMSAFRHDNILTLIGIVGGKFFYHIHSYTLPTADSTIFSFSSVTFAFSMCQ